MLKTAHMKKQGGSESPENYLGPPPPTSSPPPPPQGSKSKSGSEKADMLFKEGGDKFSSNKASDAL